MKKPVLVMAGGGTGGHVIPNIALLPSLKQHFEIYYLGEKGGIEETLMKSQSGVTFVPIPAVKFVRKLTPKNIFIPYKLLSAIKKCKKILKELNPSVIFTKGGYVSLPVALAGASLGISVLGHESDFSFGLANKIIHKKAKVMFTSFRETCISNKCIYSGSPIRPEIFKADSLKAKTACGFSQEKPTILFFGGSQGSKNINNFVFSNLDNLQKFNIIHFVGRNNSKTINLPNYKQIEFAENIYDFFAFSDIVVCRAGANSIFELLAMEKLMLLIPLSASSRGDQIENAKNFKQSGFCEVLQENDLDLDNFLAKISHLEKNKFYYIANMKKSAPNSANQIITKYLLEYAKKTQN